MSPLYSPLLYNPIMTPNADDTYPSEQDTANPTDWRYEETIQEVEAIISEIELGKLDLADVFERFAEAITYLRQCEAFLADRQGQMDLLIEELGDETEF